MNFITSFIAHQLGKLALIGAEPFAKDTRIPVLPPVVQHRNPDHPRVERRKTGISARQQRRNIRAVNRVLALYPEPR